MSEDEVIIIPIVKKRKQFKGLNFDQQASITPVSKPQMKDQIGLICEGAKFSVYRDKNMEDFIQSRLQEEKQKEKLSTNLDIDPASLSKVDHKMIESTSSRKISVDLEQEIINQLPSEIINVDPQANNEEKPIQWIAGMMEMPADPENRLRTMELMIQEREIELGETDNMMTRFLSGERKVITRGPRGNFKGPINTRAAKGDYASMMRTLNYDHTQAKEHILKGEKVAGISEKTKKEREKQQQNQMNQNY